MSHKVPTATAKARGNPSKKTFSDNEAKPESVPLDELAPPAALSAKAKKVWVDIVHHLHNCGLFTVADQNTLIAYCEAFAEWQHAQKMVWKYGPVVGRTNEGKMVKFEGKTALDIESFPRVNPWVKFCNDAFNKMIKLIPKLGLSPADRAGLDVTPPTAKKSDSGFADLDDEYG